MHTHTHVHTREKEIERETKLSLRVLPGQGHKAEDTCGASRISVRLHLNYQMEIVFLQLAPGSLGRASIHPPSLLPAHRKNSQQAARLQPVCAVDDTSLNQDSHRK